MKNSHVTAIIAAAGTGSRFGGDIPKQFLPVSGGKPLLAHTLSVFENAERISEIIVALPKLTKDNAWDIRKSARFVAGGSSRQESVYNALKAINPHTDIVLIHDGARPFITEQSINALIDCAMEGYAAVPGVRATDTVKITDTDGFVLSTPDRETVWAVQTPQAFPRDMILLAHEKAREDGFTGTDDATLAERFGIVKVKILEGDPRNIKITTQADLAIAEAVIRYVGAEAAK